mgnify:CR=1
MKLLSLDPSMTCTGWAVLEGEPGTSGRILEAGTIKTDGSTYGVKLSGLAAQMRAKRAEVLPHVIVVETPFATPRGGPKGRRSDMTLPAYGMAVAAALLVAHEEWAAKYPEDWHPVAVIETPSDEWSRGLSKGKRLNRAGVMVPDDNKGARVEAVRYFYGIDIRDSATKGDAGNVADAILMGRWALMRQATN